MKQIWLTLALVLAATASPGAITATSDDFSTASNTIPAWVSVGTAGTVIEHDSSSDGDYDDGDLSRKLAYSEGMLLPGDGIKSDGGLRIDTQDAVQDNEAAGLTIAGTMEKNEVITFTGSVYNDNTSYCPFNAQLWNLTENTLLAESGNTPVQPLEADNYAPVDFSISYTASADDEGDTLQIRFRENANNAVRDVFVDSFSLTSVPPPPGLLIAASFDGEMGILAENIPRWDYTSRQVHDPANVAPNTLAVNGKSSATDYIVRDKGPGHETALFLKTINTLADDFGIYLQNMDFTFKGQNSSRAVRVSWSFDILGFNQNGNLDPRNWTVKINTGNESPIVDVLDDSAAVLAQTFSFVADTSGDLEKDGTWTTISGSTIIPPGAAGSNGSIQISADNGGYTSSGGVFLDNISVSVTNVPPKLNLIILQ